MVWGSDHLGENLHAWVKDSQGHVQYNSRGLDAVYILYRTREDQMMQAKNGNPILICFLTKTKRL